MDKIIYFKIAKGRKDMPSYKVQVFRKESGDFIIYYLQLCGATIPEDMQNIQGEMYKAYDRLQCRYKKQEEGMHTYLTYEENFLKWLYHMEQKEAWQKLWGLPIYHDYHNVENLRYLLKKISEKRMPQKAYVLGNGVGITQWLPLIADKVTYIEFYLEFATKGMEELREQLCEEYGMLTELKLVDRGEYAKLRLKSEEPVLVIDFCGTQSISVLGLKKGSVWLDMDSIESKRHLIQDRPTGVQYFSLKEIWNREILQTLDIISKFAYNTEVKKVNN